MSAMFVEKRLESTLIMEAKFVLPAGLSSEDLSSQSIMKFLSAKRKRTARSIQRQGKTANSAGKFSKSGSKKIQFILLFRFKKCLESGMKPSWVLSDEERNRRFNKFNKINMKSVNTSDKQLKKVPTSRIPELYMAFTMEEQKMLDDVHTKFQVCQKTWLKNLLLLDRNAGVNLIEAAYKVAPLKIKTWKTLSTSFHLYFVQNVVPKFLEVANLPTYDKSKIIHGRNSGVAHLFKSSQCLKMAPNKNQEVVCKKETDVCPIQKQVIILLFYED